MARVTPEQKDVVLQIPDFMSNSDALRPFTQEEMAILNNVPGSVELEEQKHLTEMTSVHSNLSKEEQKATVKAIDSDVLIEEIAYRLQTHENFTTDLKGAWGILSSMISV